MLMCALSLELLDDSAQVGVMVATAAGGADAGLGAG
jgi:hypothetical protein